MACNMLNPFPGGPTGGQLPLGVNACIPKQGIMPEKATPKLVRTLSTVGETDIRRLQCFRMLDHSTIL
jgi:hypothetical protein